jgi:hypothetical protein
MHRFKIGFSSVAAGVLMALAAGKDGGRRVDRRPPYFSMAMTAACGRQWPMPGIGSPL